MTISKFWLDVFGEIMGLGGGLVALQSLLTIRMGASPFNFQLIELFSKFLRQKMAISKFPSYAVLENMMCKGEGFPPSDHSK